MNPILVALDFSRLDDARQMARQLTDHVGGFKVGLELIMAEGPTAVSSIAELGLPVFADAKLHDIPNTVARAAANLRRAGARWVTAHVAGGRHMMESAVDAFTDGGNETGVLGITVLTSMDQSDLASVSVSGKMDDVIAKRTRLAEISGAEGVICSPWDLQIVKSAAPGLKAITPGIRLAGGAADDQKRVATPVEAMRKGADLMVIGRAITTATDPVAVAGSIAESLGDTAG